MGVFCIYYRSFFFQPIHFEPVDDGVPFVNKFCCFFCCFFCFFKNCIYFIYIVCTLNLGKRSKFLAAAFNSYALPFLYKLAAAGC